MLTRSRISRLASAGALVLAAVTLSSCGFNYATDKVYTPAEGVNNRDSQVDVLNAAIVATEDGKGTFVASLANNETPTYENGKLTNVDDKLTGLAGVGDTTLTADLKPVTVPGGGAVKLADGEGIPVTGDSIKLGDFVEVELTFENADPVTMKIPVVPNNRDFEGQDGTSLTPTDVPEGYSDEPPTHE
jgi:copper(I)-binding protein